MVKRDGREKSACRRRCLIYILVKKYTHSQPGILEANKIFS